LGSSAEHLKKDIYTLTEEAASSCPSFPLLLQSFSHAATISSDQKSGFLALAAAAKLL
jgi:hypothetical protein